MKNVNGKIVMYVSQYCSFCKKAKDLLDEKGIEYEEIDILDNSDLFNDIKLKYDVSTVPQIFIADEDGNYIKHIPGYDKLIELEKEGKLNTILNNDYDKDNTTAYNTDSNDENQEYIASHDDFM